MPTANIEKLRKYRRDWYARNKEHAKAKVAQREREMRKWLDDYKATLHCASCPEDHPACLDFHHRDGATKDDSIANLMQHGCGRKRILAEIAKCDVLCANCHRKLHDIERRLASGSGPRTPNP